MKRKLLLAVVLAMLTFVISACKQAAESSSKTTATDVTEEPTVAPTEAAEEPTTAPTEAAAQITAAATQAPEESATAMYKDGVYEIQTKPDYENFYTKATVTIEGGLITSVDWCIYDSGQNDKPFDEEYYHVYETVSDVYVQQAKDDWSGSRGYSDALIECQEVGEVDAVSGATWTNKKFKEIVNLALEQAAKQ